MRDFYQSQITIIMAIATLKEPYATFSGSLFARDDVYARMLNGKCILQRKPTKASQKQKAMRKAFADRWAGRHP